MSTTIFGKASTLKANTIKPTTKEKSITTFGKESILTKKVGQNEPTLTRLSSRESEEMLAAASKVN